MFSVPDFRYWLFLDPHVCESHDGIFGNVLVTLVEDTSRDFLQDYVSEIEYILDPIGVHDNRPCPSVCPFVLIISETAH